MTEARHNLHCRYCKSKDFVPYLDLGRQPPSNSFIKPAEVASEARYPLVVSWCRDCNLSQLLDVVPGESIFNDYIYLSSTSKALRNHYAELTKLLIQRFDVQPNALVVDIGCNDGIMLNAYGRNDLKRVGVEPSNVAAIAEKAGFEVYREFFTPKTAARIVDRHGPARIVTATNVFAHVDDMDQFVSGFGPLIGDDGVFVIEVSYLLDVIDGVLFDTIYHEHLCYLALTPAVPFFQRHGLEVFDAERVPFGASGPALRIYGRRRRGQPISPRVDAMLRHEAEWGIGRVDRYLGYAKRVSDVKGSTLDLIDQLQRAGKRLGAYGAPAKGNTLLNYFGLTTKQIATVAENNQLKQGMLTPGSHIPVVSDEQFLAAKPDVALLLSWNYLDFFLANSEYIKQGGKFLVPLPAPRILP